MNARKLIPILLIAAATLAVLSLVLGYAWQAAHLANYDPVDGTFQNFDAFRRLDLGQWPFQDFIPYLGGGALLTWPLYRLLGGTLAASLGATYFVHAAVFIATLFFLGRLSGLSRRTAFIAAPTVAIAAFLLGSIPPFGLIPPLLDANESQMGMRSLLPILSAAIVLLIARDSSGASLAARLASPGRAALLGALAGAGFIWSNDSGAPTAAADFVLLICALVEAKPNLKGIIAAIAGFVAGAAVGFGGAVTLITGGHPASWIAVNFEGVARTQAWYFTVKPAEKVYTLAQIPAPIWVLILGGAMAVLVFAWARTKRLPLLLLAYVSGAALLMAYLGWCGGMTNMRYFGGAARAALYAVPAAALWIGKPAVGWLGRRTRGAARLHVGPLSLPQTGALLLAVVLAAFAFDLAKFAAAPIAQAEGAFFAPEFDGWLSSDYRPIVDEGRRLKAEFDAEGLPAGKRLWSTYATALDVVAGSRMPTREDYIIHRFGPGERKVYVQEFLNDAPAVVATPRSGYEFWEPWAERVNWDFYRELWLRYRPVRDVAYARIWRKRAKPLAPLGEPVACAARQAAQGTVLIALQAPKGRPDVFVEATVDYRARAIHKGLFNLGGRVGLSVQAAGEPLRENAMPPGMSFALPPRGPAVFPILVPANGAATATIAAWPKGGATLKILSCAARTIIAAGDLVPADAEAPVNVMLTASRRTLRGLDPPRSADDHGGPALGFLPGPFMQDVRPGLVLENPCFGRRTVLAATHPNVAYLSGPRLPGLGECVAAHPQTRLFSKP